VCVSSASGSDYLPRGSDGLKLQTLAEQSLLYHLAIIPLMIANFRKLDVCEGETRVFVCVNVV